MTSKNPLRLIEQVPGRRWVAVVIAALALLAGRTPGLAWDYELHRLINQVALGTLPTNFPAFVRTPEAVERIGFLAGEPDRWRNVQDLALRHSSGPDHYMDLEQLAEYGLKPEALPVFRYVFEEELAVARQAHPEKFTELAGARNEDRTREMIGLVPWAIAENYSKLKSCFSYLKTFQEGGTPAEIANAQADVIYVMGTMGHYVGDACQPLHTTVHFRGWVGANPSGYTTNSRIHAWIDGGFFDKVGGPDRAGIEGRLRTARPVSVENREARPAEIFPAAVAFLVEQNKFVEPLYRLDKEGKLSGEPGPGREGKEFLEAQVAKGAQFLADIWVSAWQQAGTDGYLRTQLERRKNASREGGTTKP